MGITPITFGKRTQNRKSFGLAHGLRLSPLAPHRRAFGCCDQSLIITSTFKATPKRLRQQLAEGARYEVTQALSKPLACDGESDALLCLCGLCFF